MKVRRDANGVHLFDRQSGLNVLFDEIPVPMPQRDLAPRFVSVALTNACDLRCRFCYAPKYAARLESQTVVAWAIELDKSGCLGLGFGGGEPTLHPDFASLCQRITTNTQLAVSFTTHGHRLTRDMVEHLAGAVHFIRVSMDGTGETYARVRNRPFSALIEKLALVRSIAPFGVNYVVNAETISDLDSAAEVAFRHGAFELLLLPERSVAGKGGIDESTRDALAAWIYRNGHYRLAISDAGPFEGVPIADPFRDADGLTAYAHIDASKRLRESSFSPAGVEIGSSVESAMARLRDRRGEFR